MIYVVVLFLLLYFSVYYDIGKRTENRSFWYGIMMVAFILIAGFRWRLGADTTNYLYDFYYEIPTLNDYSIVDYLLNSPLYVLLNSIVKTIGGKFYVVQLLCATVVNVLIFKYIKKHTSFIFTSVFFYAIFAYTNYNMEIMRGSLSIVVSLFANDYFLDRKWIKGYLFLVIAFLFHPQAIILFLMPFLFFLRFNKTGILFMLGTYFISIVLMSLLGDYLWLFEGYDSIENKVQHYVNSDYYSSQGGQIGYYISSCFLPIIYIVCSFFFAKKTSIDKRLLILEPLLILCVMFIVMRMNIELAYRYVDYYRIYFCMFYANLFVGLIHQAKHVSFRLAYLRSFVIFIPFFYFIIIRGYIMEKGNGYRYYPYSSIFNREINKERQRKFNENPSVKYPFVNTKEY